MVFIIFFYLLLFKSGLFLFYWDLKVITQFLICYLSNLRKKILVFWHIAYATMSMCRSKDKLGGSCQCANMLILGLVIFHCAEGALKYKLITLYMGKFLVSRLMPMFKCCTCWAVSCSVSVLIFSLDDCRWKFLSCPVPQLFSPNKTYKGLY